MGPTTATSQNWTAITGLIDRLISVFTQLDRNTLTGLSELYAADVYFEDPAHGIQGKELLMRYFAGLFINVEWCRFKFHQLIPTGNDIILTWSMQVKHRRLNGGKPILVEGISCLKTREGKIYYQRDYFDMGAMVYEHVPLLGSVIRSIKQGL